MRILIAEDDPAIASGLSAALADSGHAVDRVARGNDADAALHPIIGRLAADASALKANPGDITPIASMRDALANYARLFDDPGSTAASDD